MASEGGNRGSFFGFRIFFFPSDFWFRISRFRRTRMNSHTPVNPSPAANILLSHLPIFFFSPGYPDDTIRRQGGRLTGNCLAWLICSLFMSAPEEPVRGARYCLSKEIGNG
jgi:hypothetical protein